MKKVKKMVVRLAFTQISLFNFAFVCNNEMIEKIECSRSYYHFKYSGRPGIFFSSCAKNGCTKKWHGKKIAFYLVAFSESLRTHPT